MKTKKKATKTKKLEKPNQAQMRSKAARAHIAEGTRLFALAGRPTKAQFVKVYGPQGPKMTWEQRAKAGVDAKHFQAALTAKGGSPTQPRQHRSEQLPNGEGFDPHPGVRYYLTYAQNSAFCEAVC